MAKRDDEELSGIDESIEGVPEDKVDPFALPRDIESEDLAKDKDVDQEVNSNEDYQKALSEAAPELKDDSSDELAPPIKSSNSQLDKFQQYMADYKKLQDQRRNADLVNGLIAAGGKIGQSIAGKYSGNFNPDQSGNQILAKMAERPVQDFEQKQIVQSRGMQLQSETESHDPESRVSEAYRNYFIQRILPKDKDGKPDVSMFPNIQQYSASDVQNLLKMVGKPVQEKATQVPLVNQKTGEKVTGVWHPVHQTFTDLEGKPLGAEYIRDYRAQTFIDPMSQERVGFSGGTGKTTGPLTGPGVNRAVPAVPSEGEAPVQLTRQMLTGQQAKQVDQARKEFMHEVKNDRQAVNSADRVLQVLESGKSFGDLPAELQDQMSRAFGQTGHITDAQMGRALGRSDWKSRLNLATSMFLEGKLDDDNREFLQEVMTVIKDQNQQFIRNKAKAHVSNLYKDLSTSPNLSKYKIKQDQLADMISVEEAASSATKPAAKPKMLKEKQSGRVVPIKADKYDDALKSGLFEKVE